MLVDDHALFARSLAIALEEYPEIEHFVIRQETGNLPDMVIRENIDIVLMDINLGKSDENDGLSTARSLLKAVPHLKIIMLTGYDLPVYRHEAKKAGVFGFLNKSITPDKLFDSILAVFQGHSCFPCDENGPVIEDLTSAEKNILRMIAAGKKRKDIAGELYISERTLSNHLQHIYEKLDVSSSAEAVAKAFQMGYIAPLH